MYSRLIFVHRIQYQLRRPTKRSDEQKNKKKKDKISDSFASQERVQGGRKIKLLRGRVCPSRYWSVWLFRRIRLAFLTDHPWTENPDACRGDTEPEDPLSRPPARTIDDRHNGIVCCPLERCPLELHTFAQVWLP